MYKYKHIDSIQLKRYVIYIYIKYNNITHHTRVPYHKYVGFVVQ